MTRLRGYTVGLFPPPLPDPATRDPSRGATAQARRSALNTPALRRAGALALLDALAPAASAQSVVNFIDGQLQNGAFGAACAPVGLANRDGIPDLAVGADRTSSSQSFTGTATLHSGASGSIRREVRGTSSCESFGEAVAGIGDVDGNGTLTIEVDLGAIPTPTVPVTVQPGETWNFQVWHRDADPMPTSSFTAAVSVAFQKLSSSRVAGPWSRPRPLGRESRPRTDALEGPSSRNPQLGR